MKNKISITLLILSILSIPGFGQKLNSYASGSEIPGYGLQLWLRADTGVILDGSKVTRWKDLSGNGNDAVEADTSRQPLIVNDELNGKPVISFDGTYDRLGFTGSKRMTQISLFTVFKNKSGALGSNPPGFILTLGPGGTYAANEHFAIKMRGMDDGDDDIIVGTEDHNDYIKATGPGIAKYDEWRNINIVRDLTVSNTTLRWNGMDATITASGSGIAISVPLGDSTASGGGIGSTDNFPDLGTVQAKCDIAEIIVYDAVLSNSDRLLIENYLKDKYNLTDSSVTSTDNLTKEYKGFYLNQNYPNPFSSSTLISYSISQPSHVTLTVFDYQGREVAMLVDKVQTPGSYEVEFNRGNLAGGIYFLNLSAGNLSENKKIIILEQ